MKFVYLLMAISLGVIAFGLYLIFTHGQPEPVDITQPPRPVGMIPAPTPEEEGDSDVPQAAPEPGSDEWCDMMMQKANHLWTDEEPKIFADNCIYQDE